MLKGKAWDQNIEGMKKEGKEKEKEEGKEKRKEGCKNVLILPMWLKRIKKINGAKINSRQFLRLRSIGKLTRPRKDINN